ncbi:hypothetical protein DIZ76_016229 [Coccidioides immitis]|uniref:Uncharacterized protein n=1 Tax=Coccidioides immitis RMSCC 2394 TaxID=404692 RepID=A0A0J6YLM1_COCIT|nr:hypothetical protein CIRG_09710 [Coccidioides immitis RMSCC 2394]TPX20341.1 hypothetical protein DIZ76_016229 [Coccidioides immitis]
MEPFSLRSKYQEVFVNDNRQDQKIVVEEHGVEPGSRRFPNKREIPAPQPATWRNNLTALSQHRNLYFVAFMHEIYVYQPTIHSVGVTPKLILTPLLANPSAAGYISQSRPHSINHIVVGDLGNEEILLLSTDSGNVSAYRTERILSAIEQTKGKERQKPTDLGASVPCFFTDWVRQSAWGLAIHKFARLIAVSANTSEITVWAFALVDQDVKGHKEPESGKQSCTTDWARVISPAQFEKLCRLPPQHRRSRNLRITLCGHPNNIPCVDFLNCELDPHGEWLLSTDISNRLLGWRIWESPIPVTGWNLNAIWRSQGQDYIADSYERGWGVLALDPRSFRLKSSVEEACGGRPFVQNRGDTYDITSLIDHVPRASTRYTVLPLEHRNGSQPQNIGNGPAPESNLPVDPDDDLNLDEGFNQLGQIQESLDVVVAANEADSGSDSEEPSTLNTQTGMQYPPVLVASQGTWNEPEESLIPTEEIDGQLQGTPDMVITEVPDIYGWDDSNEVDDDMDEGEEQTADEDANAYLVDALLESLYGPTDTSSQASDSALEDSIDHARAKPEAYVEFPILHFSESDIRMLSGPYSEKASVVCRMALRQMIPELAPAITNRDRLNMVHQIPELGVVVAASQKGRVAIISLTEVLNVGRFMRIDHIVPFESQEQLGMRPLVPLVGIAVGPVESNLVPVEGESSDDEFDGSFAEDVEGMDDPMDGKKPVRGYERIRRPPGLRMRTPREPWHGSQYSRKYRLILMYLDHTVLRYELFYDWPNGVLGGKQQDRGSFTLAPWT